MKNNKLLIAVGYAIIFAVFNLLTFVFNPVMNTVFWCSYGFTVLAFTLQILAFIVSYKRNTKARDVFFGIPLTAISFVYLIAQTIVGTLFMSFTDASIKAAIVIQAILLAVYLIVSVSALLGKNTVLNLDEDTKEKVLFIKLLEDDVVALKAKTADPAVTARLDDLSELIHYSDPISHTSLALVEQKISVMINKLSDTIAENNTYLIGLEIDKIEEILAERNRKCKLLKK